MTEPTRGRLPLLTQRRRWVAFGVAMAGVSLAPVAPHLPEPHSGLAFLGGLTVTLAAVGVLGFWPRPESPFE